MDIFKYNIQGGMPIYLEDYDFLQNKYHDTLKGLANSLMKSGDTFCSVFNYDLIDNYLLVTTEGFFYDIFADAVFYIEPTYKEVKTGNLSDIKLIRRKTYPYDKKEFFSGEYHDVKQLDRMYFGLDGEDGEYYRSLNLQDLMDQREGIEMYKNQKARTIANYAINNNDKLEFEVSKYNQMIVIDNDEFTDENIEITAKDDGLHDGERFEVFNNSGTPNVNFKDRNGTLYNISAFEHAIFVCTNTNTKAVRKVYRFYLH